MTSGSNSSEQPSTSGQNTLSLPFQIDVKFPALPQASVVGSQIHHLIAAAQSSLNRGYNSQSTAVDVVQRRQSNAAKLRSALKVIEHADWKNKVLSLVELGGLLGACGQLLQPQGPGGCDRNVCEKCCNVVSSFPFVVCGCHAMRNRRTQEGRLWGASMAGVGVASACFHGSSGTWRSWGRKLDYWSIAVASNFMTKAVYPALPPAITSLGILATPFKPFLVSFVNSAAMEYKFLQRSHKNPKLRNAQLLHSACVAVGLAAFALEEFKPDMPLVHTAWHCLSATGVATINVLLADVEENELGITPLRLPSEPAMA